MGTGLGVSLYFLIAQGFNWPAFVVAVVLGAFLVLFWSLTVKVTARGGGPRFWPRDHPQEVPPVRDRVGQGRQEPVVLRVGGPPYPSRVALQRLGA